MRNILLSFLLLFSFNISAQNIIFTNNNKTQDNETDSIINSLITKIKPDSIRSTIQSLQNYTTRFMIEPNRKSIALSLKDKFISMGYLNTVIDSFETITNFVWTPLNIHDTTCQYNVIATLDGTLYPDSICIAGGHYDSFSDSANVGKAPGADDDASGVAATFEIARVFKEMNFQPKMTIKFIAFAAEELMFYSSESGAGHYAKEAQINGEKIKFYANNDMIAFNKSDSAWKTDFHCFTGMDWMKNFATTMCQNYTSITPVIFNDNMGGDALRFYQKGYQTLHFEEFEFNPYYHKSYDVIDSINMNYCAEMTKITMAMLISSTQINSDVEDYNSNLNISVNIYPNPANAKITIDNNEIYKVKMQVYNMIGSCVNQTELCNGKNDIDVSSLSKGIYVIQITGDDWTVQRKLIKE